MCRRLTVSILFCGIVFCCRTALAEDFFWVIPAGGQFSVPTNWLPFSLVPPFMLGPGGDEDTVNFDLGIDPDERYDVSSVGGENDRLLVHNDSLRLGISDYAVSGSGADEPSFVVGVGFGDVADLALIGTTDAELSTSYSVFGQSVGSSGAVSIGIMQWSSSQLLTIGEAGGGALEIFAGADVSNTASKVGDEASSTGAVTVTGSGSSWNVSTTLAVGHGGMGSLTIESGGDVVNSTGLLGNEAGSTGEATVTGNGSTWTNSDLRVGNNGNGELIISSVGAVSSDNGRVGFGSNSLGTVTVTGNASTWTVDFELDIGTDGMGSLSIENGADVSSGTGFVARNAGSSASVTVTGGGSSWTIAEQLSIGGDASTGINGGNGILDIEQGGTVSVTEHIVVFPNGFLRLYGGTLSTQAISFEGGGQFNWFGGTLEVEEFDGNLTNVGDGTLAPGESAGNTAITGNYTQNVGTLAIEIGGVFDGQFDTVEVAGNASLGGMLNVTLIAGFEPVLGNSFTILTTEVGNVAGKFAGVSLPIFDELTFDIVYDLNNVVLEVVEVGLHADYNENGVVDAADYTVWRDTLGSMGLEPYSLGDGNGDGDVTQADYDIWRSHFGQSIPAAAAAANASTPVPEPGVLSLVLGIASISWICDFGKRRTVRTP